MSMLRSAYICARTDFGKRYITRRKVSRVSRTIFCTCPIETAIAGSNSLYQKLLSLNDTIRSDRRKYIFSGHQIWANSAKGKDISRISLLCCARSPTDSSLSHELSFHPSLAARNRVLPISPPSEGVERRFAAIFHVESRGRSIGTLNEQVPRRFDHKKTADGSGNGWLRFCSFTMN